jgi:hypothetical protein
MASVGALFVFLFVASAHLLGLRQGCCARAGALALVADLETLAAMVSVGALFVFLCVAAGVLWRRCRAPAPAPARGLAAHLAALVALSLGARCATTLGRRAQGGGAPRVRYCGAVRWRRCLSDRHVNRSGIRACAATLEPAISDHASRTAGCMGSLASMSLGGVPGWHAPRHVAVREARGDLHAGISLAFRLGAPAWAGAALAAGWLAAVGGLAARPVHFRADKFRMPLAPLTPALAILATVHLIGALSPLIDCPVATESAMQGAIDVTLIRCACRRVWLGLAPPHAPTARTGPPAPALADAAWCGLSKQCAVQAGIGGALLKRGRRTQAAWAGRPMCASAPGWCSACSCTAATACTAPTRASTPSCACRAQGGCCGLCHARLKVGAAPLCIFANSRWSYAYVKVRVRPQCCAAPGVRHTAVTLRCATRHAAGRLSLHF